MFFRALFVVVFYKRNFRAKTVASDGETWLGDQIAGKIWYGWKKKKVNNVLRGTRHNPNHHSLKGLVLVLLHMYMDGSVSHVDVVM